MEKAGGGQTAVIFALEVLFGHLALVALYEGWTIAIPVRLTTVGLAGAMIGVLVAGLDNNFYAQIGIVVLIALVANNGFLIVEFAELHREEVLSIAEAALDGVRERCHAVMMMNFGFIAGPIPLVVAQGAAMLGRRCPAPAEAP